MCYSTGQRAQCPGAYAVDIMQVGEERTVGYEPGVMCSTGGPTEGERIV
jgi:hypothetical protein